MWTNFEWTMSVGFIIAMVGASLLSCTHKNHRRSFGSQTSDNMDIWKVGGGKIQRRKSQKKEAPGARKGRKAAWRYVLPMFCGSGRSTSRLAKASGAEPSGRWKPKNCTLLWREAHFEIKSLKHIMPVALWEVEMSKKRAPLSREAHS